MKLHDVKQGTDDWLRLRLGIPTASDFDKLISPTWKIREGEGPKTYLYEKVTERIMGMGALGMAGSFAMEQGSIMEHEAIPYYAFTYDVNVKRVGFITTDDGRVGCSPDGLIGEDGGIECKCPAPDTHLRYLIDGVLPKEYAAQVHGSMFVTGRPWWVFMSYSRQFPALVVRVERDEAVQIALKEAVEAFNGRIDATLARIKALTPEPKKHVDDSAEWGTKGKPKT
jgi:hypothetical protein